MIERVFGVGEYEIKMPSDKTYLKSDFETEHLHIPIKIY
jgi:hypothetical protein